MSKREKENQELSIYNKFFEEKIIKVSLNSLIGEIQKTRKKMNQSYNLGISDQQSSYDEIREEALKKLIGNSDSTSLEISATSKVLKGKKNIIAISYTEANALSMAYGVDFWANSNPILCTVSANDKKCKANLIITSKVSSQENFVAVSKALAKKINLKNNDQITLSNIRFDIKRINLDKIDNNSNENDQDDEY